MSLVLAGQDETFSWVRPTVEAGWELQFRNHARARFYGRVGVQRYLGDEATEIGAGLAGADGVALAPLVTSANLGQDGIQSLLGIDYLFSDNMTLQLQYRYETADELELNAGQLKFSMAF